MNSPNAWKCLLVLPLILGCGIAAAQPPAIEGLATACDFEAHRITSADPTGGNADFWDIQPGETRVLAEIQGPGRIVHFRDNVTGNEPHHLQFHVLRIYWDGEKEPSVEVPFGDFFGIGFGFTEKYSSALMAIDQRRGRLTDPAASGAARNCYIPMPFARSARITLTNEGKKPSRHWVEINYRTYPKPQENELYFHAQYRQATPPPAGPYLILDAKGRGHLLGCVLSVKNNDGGWWGEGDEILYIDGKHAMQGTGSEDYFCESYGLRPGCFPYFGVPVLEEPYTTAYRWHVPDPVPFRESLRFLIEHGNGEPPFRSGNYFYSVAYWYQTEPHAAFPKMPTTEERTSWAGPPRKKAVRDRRQAAAAGAIIEGTVDGAIEGETMKILSKTGGMTEVQMEGSRWSNGRQLWWRDGKVGDRLELALCATKAGRYKLVMHNTRADDYGTFQLSLDNEKLGEPIDFYSDENITKLVTLGERELSQGEHNLLVEITGTNPAAKPRYMFGLDYVKLEAAAATRPAIHYRIAATRRRDAMQVIEGKSGPWGRLEYMPLAIDLPDEYVFVPPPSYSPVRWFLKGHSREQAVEFFRSAGLTRKEIEQVQKAKWKPESSGVTVEPGDELILGLSPAARAKIYSRLVEFEENAKQIDPIWFRPGQVDERLKGSELSKASIDLLKGLLYAQGEDLLLFADFEPASRRLPNDEERRRFMQATSRKATLSARLKIDANCDIAALAAYWSMSGRQKDIIPLLRAAQRSGESKLDIACLLPPFARQRLYTYPLSTGDPKAVKQDSFWTAMNLLNREPDDRFNDMAYIQQVLQRDYYNILEPSQLGDVIFLATSDSSVIHAAAYIADDIVFTKNGASYTQPWILMRLRDMIDTFGVRHPSSGPLKVLYYRRKAG